MAYQTVLITGASRGLGAATARIVAEMGANAALMARSADELAMLVDEIQGAGGHALSIIGDVRQVTDCRVAVKKTIERFGQLDAVVNNAGTLAPIAAIADGDPGEWQENLGVNLLGPVWITQAALPYLRERCGRVINVSSGAAVNVIAGWAAYCAAKAALNHFTRALAHEEPEITAIAFRPGVIDTDMQAAIRRHGARGMPEEVHARFVRYRERGELLPPAVPGCSLAILALNAPHEWSGAFLPWNSEDVLSLVRSLGTAPCASAQGT